MQGTFAYDAMNRQVGRWACLYTTHVGCAAGTHLEGSYAVFTGNKVTRLINEQGDNTLGYDDLGRLAYRGPTGGGSGPTLNWTYDRFGNRLSQTGGGTGGSAPQISLNISPNSNKDTGFTYDLAGNLLNDGVHSYTYDQEGNLIYVDNGYTTWDNYDALNRRIMHVTGNYTNYLRYEYNLDGRLAEVWQGEDTYEKLSRYYGPRGDSFAYWTLAGGAVHYQHTDYLGTVKIRTDPNHNTEAAYSDLPFGERTGTAGTDDNTEHYALLDTDSESDTHHAQFRTYEPRIGRWLQPDPYDGSYNANNPQSLNRYNYVLNNPLVLVDPSGLFSLPYHGDDNWFCDAFPYECGGVGGGAGTPVQQAPDDPDDPTVDVDEPPTISASPEGACIPLNAIYAGSPQGGEFLVTTAYELSRAGAYLTGKTVGIGVTGSVGVGAGGPGFIANASTQIVSTPEGESALVSSVTYPAVGYLKPNSGSQTAGAAQVGFQVSIGPRSNLTGGTKLMAVTVH